MSPHSVWGRGLTFIAATALDVGPVVRPVYTQHPPTPLMTRTTQGRWEPARPINYEAGETERPGNF